MTKYWSLPPETFCSPGSALFARSQWIYRKAETYDRVGEGSASATRKILRKVRGARFAFVMVTSHGFPQPTLGLAEIRSEAGLSRAPVFWNDRWFAYAPKPGTEKAAQRVNEALINFRREVRFY